jgi:hypothetical protein
VLDKVIDSFDSNFTVNLSWISARNAYSGESLNYNDIYTHRPLNNIKKLSIPTRAEWRDGNIKQFYRSYRWIEDLNIYEIVEYGSGRNYFESNKKKYVCSESNILDKPVYMYIIGVIAGWIHLNLDKILPYEYLIFIDCDETGISFKLITTKKHTLLPERFLYDWRRFIFNGVKN